ncbi:helix-turn-helix domain-containing protein [Kitasatospora sp. LaBMicrA B282]|uniref:helix-turn-helix domain-containing protein n=1 Tax=Kitasatospora sp. LaBMicrA B282 TaxID=3420949 RepID=UPI003D0B8FC3
MRRSRPPAPTPVPFSPHAAREHRVLLGLTTDQVAHALAAHGVRLLPTHVAGWENGEIRPTEDELIALGRALWCPAAELMGTTPVALRDFRVARELTQQQAASRIGMGLRGYAAAELSGRWTGDPEQSAALCEALEVSLRDLVRLQGADAELEQRVRQCLDGRWQAQLKPVSRLLPVPADTLAGVLAALQNERQATSGHWGTGNWGGPAPATGQATEAGASPVDRFWSLLARRYRGALKV